VFPIPESEKTIAEIAEYFNDGNKTL